MPANSIFENISPGSLVQEAAAATLLKWMPTYLREIERQLSRTLGQIPAPRTYTSRNRFESFPEDQMPLCVVVSSGLVDTPSRESDGRYNAWFSLGIGFLASARDEDAADFLSKVYAAAGRAIILQRPSLGGVASGVEWIDETYDDDVVTEDQRTMKASYVIFRIHMDDIVTRFAGPVEPDAPDPATQPGSTWPTADTIDIQVVIP